jgi:hypothetical protein
MFINFVGHPESGFGSRDPIKSGSNPDPDTDPSPQLARGTESIGSCWQVAPAGLGGRLKKYVQ